MRKWPGIIENQRNMKKNMSNFSVSTVSADGLAPLGVMTKSAYILYISSVLIPVCWWHISPCVIEWLEILYYCLNGSRYKPSTLNSRITSVTVTSLQLTYLCLHCTQNTTKQTNVNWHASRWSLRFNNSRTCDTIYEKDIQISSQWREPDVPKWSGQNVYQLSDWLITSFEYEFKLCGDEMIRDPQHSVMNTRQVTHVNQTLLAKWTQSSDPGIKHMANLIVYLLPRKTE